MHRFLETNFQKVVEVDLQTFVCETLHQKLFEENSEKNLERKNERRNCFLIYLHSNCKMSQIGEINFEL